MDDIGPYEVKRIPKGRLPIIDYLDAVRAGHQIAILLKVDVTEAKARIRSYRDRTGRSLSFTGWICHTIGRVLPSHIDLHAMRKGSREKVIFKDIDITVQIEREGKDGKVPRPYVVRKVQKKSVRQLTDEIKKAKEEPLKGKEVEVLGDRFYLKKLGRLYPFVPRPVRVRFWKRYLRDPFLMKRVSGLVQVTSVGMEGRNIGYAIPPSGFPLNLVIGSIDEVSGREVLFMTLVLDHDIVDGGPGSRFISDLVRTMESAEGLPHVDD